ncbi:MAG: thiamine pyrophosphate-binding protein [Alsobacter sp.]
MAERVADTIGRALRAAGIRFAFGMPGGEVVTLVDGLERAGIRFVLARHETAAAMMAAGAAVSDDAPGLLVTTLGPGLANAVNGIADAAQERVPLLVLSGVVERAVRSRYTHQIVDHAALLRPLVKASFEIEPEGAAATVRRALALANTPPCGPVHLDLSPAVAAMPSAEIDPILAAPARPPAGIDPQGAAARALRDALAQARRPLLVAGFEAARGDAREAVMALAEGWGVPVVTTYKAKGLIDEDHPAALGAAGLSPLADKILLGLAAESDLIILAGYDPIEMRAGWLDPFPASARIVELGTLPADHGMHAAALRLEGPVAALLSAGMAGLRERRTWAEGQPARARQALRQAFAAPRSWGPHAAFETLQASLPADATVTIDSGAHRILLSQMLRLKRPLSVLQSAGWCTMGAAVPLAIGAKIAAPARPVVAVLGDGGLEMGLGELGTLRDQRLPVVVLVLQDESLALIALKQSQAGLPAAGVGLGATRFDLVAEAFGGRGVTVSDRTSLEAALREAFAADRFTVIACRIEAGAYVGRF